MERTMWNPEIEAISLPDQKKLEQQKLIDQILLVKIGKEYLIM